MNLHLNLLERCNKISFAPSALISRNYSKKPTKKKPEIIKISITSRTSFIKPQSLHAISKQILISNNRKYNSTPEVYNKNIITSIIFDERKKIVCIFKNSLLWEETSEFFKRFYSRKESLNRIPKISSYYETYTLFCPVYFSFSLSLVKLMNRFSKRKKRYLEYLEDKEDKESIIKEIGNDQYSKIIKESQINNQDLILTIINKQDEHSITLSKISVDNSKLSFNELINTSLSEEYLKEEKIKPKKFILKKTTNQNTHNKHNNNVALPFDAKTRGVQIPRINLQGITKFKTDTNLNRNKRNVKQAQLITYTNTNTLSNNSLNKQITGHLTTTARLYSNKTKAMINRDIQSKSNKVDFNVNLNVNVNININHNHIQPPVPNKLVLTTQKKNIRHKMLIAEKYNNDLIIPKIINSGISQVKTKKFLNTDNTQSINPKNESNTIKLESTSRELSTIKTRRNTTRQINPNKGHLITISKTKEQKKYVEIQRIDCANYPLTTRGYDDYKGLSGNVISQMINTNSNLKRSKNNGQLKQRAKYFV